MAECNGSNYVFKNCSDHNNLHCVFLNAWSIVNKCAMLSSILDDDKPDIVFIVETFLSPEIPSSEIIPGYQVFQKDRSRKRGGVLIAAKEGICISQCNNDDSDAEILWCRVDLENEKPIHLGVFYRPHDTDVSYMEKLYNSCERLQCDRYVLTGDFNIPHIDWIEYCETRKSELSSSLLNFVLEHFLVQHVTDITRFSSTNSVIDLIQSTEASLVSGVEIKPGIRDHERINFNINVKKLKEKCVPRSVLVYNIESVNELRNAISHADWGQTMDLDSVENSWNAWKDLLLKLISETIPVKTIKGHNKCAKWMTSDLRKLIRKQNWNCK
jgi:hypothetical protein